MAGREAKCFITVNYNGWADTIECLDDRAPEVTIVKGTTTRWHNVQTMVSGFPISTKHRFSAIPRLARPGTVTSIMLSNVQRVLFYSSVQKAGVSEAKWEIRLKGYFFMPLKNVYLSPGIEYA
jgi:hypothetical protein